MNGKWLKTEFKRAAVMLPGILKRAALLLLVFGAAAAAAVFCVGLTDKKQDAPDLKIGYSAAGSRLTDMVIDYVRDIESVKELCIIEKVSIEEGMRLLQKGELDALVELPDDIVGEILSGSNAPAKVYISDGGTVKNLLFREFADAAVGMLETAQAQIYAVGYILGDAAYDDGELINNLYGDINRFNISAAAGREDIFKKKTLSVTENDTRAIYYASAALALYMLIVGIFFEAFLWHGAAWRNMLEKRLNASRMWQLACGFLAGVLPMLIMALMPLAILPLLALMPVFKVSVNPALPLDALCLMLFAAALCVIYFMLIYQIFGKRRNALPAIGIMAAAQGYMSGCIVPSVLLPDLVYGVGKYLPAAFLKESFRIILTGDSHNFSHAATGLLAWCAVLFISGIICFCFDFRFEMQCDERYYGAAAKSEGFSGSKTLMIPSPAWVVFKRMLLKKGILASLLLMAAASLFIARLEDKSDTTFTAAVFDESGEYEKLLSAHEGLVRFYLCESEDEVQKLVLKDKAECGYILPKNLTKDIISGRANRTLTVYEDSDSICVPLVNEVIFNSIFRHASLEWYKDYMAGFGADLGVIEKLFDEQIESGRTFGIELVTLGEDGEAKRDIENKGTYPVEAVVFAAVILCGIQGLLIVAWDCKKGRFGRRARLKIAVLTVVLPMIMAGVVGVAICIFM